MIGALLGGSKLWLYGIAAIAIGATVYAGYAYVSNLQTQITQLSANNATLTANNLALKQSITTQQQTIDGLQADFETQRIILAETNDKFAAERDRVARLQENLSEHELGFLASQRPGLVERVVNNATDMVGRCFEIASGAPLTVAESTATLPSQINTSCPELANPSYIQDNQ